MVNEEDVEVFWTRGDIHSRVHLAMTKANLVDKKLEIEEFTQAVREECGLSDAAVSEQDISELFGEPPRYIAGAWLHSNKNSGQV